MNGMPLPAEAVPGESLPAVRVNLYGYLARGPKAATVVSDERAPLAWRVLRGDDEVARGHSTPRGHDHSAGLDAHVVEFDEVDEPGVYVLDVAHAGAAPFLVADALYDDLRTDALGVFYGQRSGIAIEERLLGEGYARAAGHLEGDAHGGDTRVPCLPAGHATGDDGVDLYEGWTDTHVLDVRGGWYDAGDHGKYVVNGGIAVAQLLGLYERATIRGTHAALGDGSGRVPEQGNGVPDVLDEARWELEWMLRMQVPAGQRHAGMAHHKVVDERWTGIPLLPADDPQPRYLHRPSTAATLNLAAAAAQGARLFRGLDAAFADRLLAAAALAYDAARATPDLFAPDTNTLPNAGGGPYDDREVDDEFLWAAAELHLTTGDQRYADDVLANPYFTGAKAAFEPEGFDWEHTAPLGVLDLATVPGAPSAVLDGVRDRARALVVEAADALVETQGSQPFGHPYAPRDGRYDWGSNGLLLNNLVTIATAYDLTGDERYRDAVASGMDYVLGRNAMAISYVTGYGEPHARNQHSRWYAHQADPALPHPPAGTVSGGPNSATPDPVSQALAGSPAQRCYVDDVGAFGVNEMTINWNAPLAWVAAFLSDAYSSGFATGQ